MTVQVWHQKLRDAAQGWEDQSDDLYGAGKSLASAADNVGLLGSRVSSVATSFITTWGDAVAALRTQADQHSTSLTETSTEFLVSDKDTVDAMQRLLSWEDRDTVPVAPRNAR